MIGAGQFGDEVLCVFLSLLQADTDKYQYKFDATELGDSAAFWAFVLQASGCLDQDFVANIVTDGIINQLDTFDVKKDDSYQIATTFCQIAGISECLLQDAAVG